MAEARDTPRTEKMFFSVDQITKRFGGLVANEEISFFIERGEILGIIGHNGAGKTTLFNIITGVIRPDSGRVVLEGEDITGKATAKIASKGVVRTFQASTLFAHMSALDNVITAHYLANKVPFWKYLVQTGKVKQRETLIRKRTEELLDFFGLSAQRHELASSLPFGHQRALSICIALAAEPKLLLLDEPVTGMNESETEEMMAHIRRIRDGGITIAIIEHDMRALMGLSDRVVALNAGRKIAEGLPDEIRVNEEVIESYLGREEDY